MDKVVRDGMVGVIVSPGYGAGWYSWERVDGLLFDPVLIAAVEAKDHAAIEVRAEEIAPECYHSGIEDLIVVWVPEGSHFRIDEYDGSESLHIRENEDWIVA